MVMMTMVMIKTTTTTTDIFNTMAKAKSMSVKSVLDDVLST